MSDRTVYLRMVLTIVLGLPFVALVLFGAGRLFESEEPSGASWLPRYSGAINTDEALLQGTLVREGNCLYIDASGTRWLPIFPSGSTFDVANDTLETQGQRFRLGMQFAAAGSAAETLDAIPGNAQPDPSCDTIQIWVVDALLEG